MTGITNLIQAAIDKSPLNFASEFDSIMTDKITDAIADRRIDIAQSIYGSPESNEHVDVDELDANIDVDIDLDGLEDIEVGETDEQD
jgi:hypothetical protein